MKKPKAPAKVHHFQEGHIVTFAATVVSGLISTVALSYHVWVDLKTDLEAIRWTFTILAGAFAFHSVLTYSPLPPPPPAASMVTLPSPLSVMVTFVPSTKSRIF